MSQKTKVILWISGIILLFGMIFLIWAYDTGRLGIKAEADPTVTSVTDLKELPSSDPSTFAKIFTIPAKIIDSISSLFK